jgi:hypothetical protein
MPQPTEHQIRELAHDAGYQFARRNNMHRKRGPRFAIFDECGMKWQGDSLVAAARFLSRNSSFSALRRSAHRATLRAGA